MTSVTFAPYPVRFRARAFSATLASMSSSNGVVRIVVADDHPVVLSGLEAIFGREAGFLVVAACGDGERAFQAITELAPDVALLDLHMPRKGAVAILRELHERRIDTRVVVLTASISEDETIAALRLGVKGILLKSMPPRLLVECVRQVSAGGRWFENVSVGRVLERMLSRERLAEQLAPVLTRRELEIVRLAIQKLSNDAIAERLRIARGTVKIHLHSVYRKLGVSGRPALLRFAKEKALV